jgi:hypothetical protein
MRREKMNGNVLLVKGPDGKRPLLRPRRRCVDNIKMDIGEIRFDGVGCNGLA